MYPESLASNQGARLERNIQSAEGWGSRGGLDTHLEVPVSCDSQPVAGPTEMLRHRCDEADLALETGDFKGLWAGVEEEMRVGQLSLHDIRSDTIPSPREPCRKQPARPSDNRNPELSARAWPAQDEGS